MKTKKFYFMVLKMIVWTVFATMVLIVVTAVLMVNKSYAKLLNKHFKLNIFVSGTSYGQGVYFALNSSYSDNYGRSQSVGYRKMFRCKVLVGETTHGTSSMRTPPLKPNKEPYDSTTNNENTIFVCYNDNQCYPEYLITYAPTSEKCSIS